MWSYLNNFWTSRKIIILSEALIYSVICKCTFNEQITDYTSWFLIHEYFDERTDKNFILCWLDIHNACFFLWYLQLKYMTATSNASTSFWWILIIFYCHYFCLKIIAEDFLMISFLGIRLERRCPRLSLQSVRIAKLSCVCMKVFFQSYIILIATQ